MTCSFIVYHAVYLLMFSEILTSTWGSIFRNRDVIPSNETTFIWCLIQHGCLLVWRFYLRLGWTCLTAALKDCVHWPPGPSHMESDLRRFLWGMLSLTSHNQDATRGKTATREDIQLLHFQQNWVTGGQMRMRGWPWHVRLARIQGPRLAACLWGRGRAEETACCVCNPARLTSGCCSGWPEGAAPAGT